MKYLSLFSGIGGFELGIQQSYDNRPNIRNGTEVLQEDSTDPSESQDRITCIGYSEIDKYATQIYQSHYPYKQCELCATKRSEVGGGETNSQADEGQGLLSKEGEDTGAKRGQPSQHAGDEPDERQLNCECKHKPYGDIKTINASELPDFDFLCGGFPCQSFSIAGKRDGFEDTRGTLFFDIARILRAKQPRLLLLENVKGLLSHDSGKTFHTIIKTLDELGYDLQWQVLNSKNFGVPQNRERVFIVGHLRGTSRPEVFPIIGENPVSCHEVGTITAIKGAEHSRRCYSPEGLHPTLSTAMGGNIEKKFLFPDAKIRRLTPKECERLQGFPDNWTEGISDTQRYKCCGNAVTVNVIQAIMEKLLK